MMFFAAEETGEVSEVVAAVSEVSNSYWEQLMELFDGLPVKVAVFGFKALVAVILFFVGRKLINIVIKAVTKSMERAEVELSVRNFTKYCIQAVGYILLAVVILAIAGVQPTAFATVLSSVTVALGLAIQGSLSNFAGGILILLTKPFKVGDYIKEDTNGNEGTVVNIGLVYTTLLSIDSRTIILPNGNLANNSIVNYSAQEKRQLNLTVGISYGSDIKLAKTIIERLLDEHPAVLKDENRMVFVSALGESEVTIGYRAWTLTPDYWPTVWDMTENVKTAFDAEGVEIPFNQIDVHVKEGSLAAVEAK